MPFHVCPADFFDDFKATVPVRVTKHADSPDLIPEALDRLVNLWKLAKLKNFGNLRGGIGHKSLVAYGEKRTFRGTGVGERNRVVPQVGSGANVACAIPLYVFQKLRHSGVGDEQIRGAAAVSRRTT